MSGAAGLRDPLLVACGVSHAFGLRDSVPPQDLRRPRQVHGIRVAAAGDAELGDADAIVSALADVPVGIVTADCVPVLLCDEAGRAVAAIHAGWRGLAAGVLGEGVQALAATCRGARLVAAIGPHIGACCYEVDRPVVDALDPLLGERLAPALRHSRPGHWMLDLGLAARAALVDAGVADRDVGVAAAQCTRCDATRFHSFRRDGAAAGRLVHWIQARGNA